MRSFLNFKLQNDLSLFSFCQMQKVLQTHISKNDSTNFLYHFTPLRWHVYDIITRDKVSTPRIVEL